MLDKHEALSRILEVAPAPRESEEVPAIESVGRVLSRDVVSDIAMPPFDRSSMDGWAVRSEDVREPGATLAITGRIMAGQVAEGRVEAGQTMKIMTGAPVPEGADAVIMVEQSQEQDGSRVVLTAAARPGQNVCPRGEDLQAGEKVLPAGTPLTPETAAVLAMVGADPVSVWRLPNVCLVPTGDELVPSWGPPPAPGMIRESNGLLMACLVRRTCPALHPVLPGIARDDEKSIDAMLDVGLGHVVLCLSGGVSMGDLDLVGTRLKARGLEVLVEKVRIKPGKPLLFGRVQGAFGHVCHVFGLPGNPVSTHVTFELFVRPFLLRCMGHADVSPDEVDAELDSERPLRNIPRAQHLPARLRVEQGRLLVRPVEWHGSADLRGLAQANALVLVEAGAEAPRPGDRVRVHRLPEADLGVGSFNPPGCGRT